MARASRPGARWGAGRHCTLRVMSLYFRGARDLARCSNAFTTGQGAPAANRRRRAWAARASARPPLRHALSPLRLALSAATTFFTFIERAGVLLSFGVGAADGENVNCALRPHRECVAVSLLAERERGHPAHDQERAAVCPTCLFWPLRAPCGAFTRVEPACCARPGRERDRGAPRRAARRGPRPSRARHDECERAAMSKGVRRRPAGFEAATPDPRASSPMKRSLQASLERSGRRAVRWAGAPAFPPRGALRRRRRAAGGALWSGCSRQDRSRSLRDSPRPISAVELIF